MIRHDYRVLENSMRNILFLFSVFLKSNSLGANGSPNESPLGHTHTLCIRMGLICEKLVFFSIGLYPTSNLTESRENSNFLVIGPGLVCILLRIGAPIDLQDAAYCFHFHRQLNFPSVQPYRPISRAFYILHQQLVLLFFVMFLGKCRHLLPA